MKVKKVFLVTLTLTGIILLAFFAALKITYTNLYGKIAIVKVKGVINTSENYVKTLEKLKNDNSVKAIVLRVDSPGGVVGACQEIHDKVKEVASKKPVVVSMGSVAASGGLYISVPATKIVANPGTITGSIGVIIQSYNFKKLAQKLGIEAVTIKSGKYKDLLNPFKTPSRGEIQILQTLINDSYQQFIKAVAEGRNLPIEKVKEFADGRVFSGERAKKLGLVDYLGGLDKAVKIAKRLSHSPNSVTFEVTRKKGLLEKIMGKESESLLKRVLRILNGVTEETKIMYLYR